VREEHRTSHRARRGAVVEDEAASDEDYERLCSRHTRNMFTPCQVRPDIVVGFTCVLLHRTFSMNKM